MAAIMQTPRWLQRRDIRVPEHLQALDTDVDNIEAAIEIGQANYVDLSSKVDRMNARLLGLSLSILGAALALIANLAIHH